MKNCHSEQNFPFESGTCKGDPLLVFLFVLYLERLFIQIRDNESMKGIDVNNYQITL